MHRTTSGGCESKVVGRLEWEYFYLISSVGHIEVSSDYFRQLGIGVGQGLPAREESRVGRSAAKPGAGAIVAGGGSRRRTAGGETTAPESPSACRFHSAQGKSAGGQSRTANRPHAVLPGRTLGVLRLVGANNGVERSQGLTGFALELPPFPPNHRRDARGVQHLLRELQRFGQAGLMHA